MNKSAASSPPTRREFLGQAAGLTAVAAGWVSSRAADSAPGRPRVPVIDCHVHAGLGQTLVSPWTTIAEPEETLRHMDEAGIDQSVIVPNANRTYEEANRAIAAYCRKWPTRFIGFAKHDAVTEKGRIRELLTHEIRELGLRGYKSHSPQPTREVLETVAELGIPYLYHAAKVADAAECARDFPTINFIFAHLGSYGSRSLKEFQAALEAAQRFPNVFLDTSTVLETRSLEQAIRELGADRICFGSDGPDCDSRLEIFKIRMLGLPKEQEEKILGGNLQRILGARSAGVTQP